MNRPLDEIALQSVKANLVKLNEMLVNEDLSKGAGYGRNYTNKEIKDCMRAIRKDTMRLDKSL